jgi:hypothetical protein
MMGISGSFRNFENRGRSEIRIDIQQSFRDITLVKQTISRIIRNWDGTSAGQEDTDRR